MGNGKITSPTNLFFKTSSSLDREQQLELRRPKNTLFKQV